MYLDHMENITNFFKNIPTIWREAPPQSNNNNQNVLQSNIPTELNNIEQHYYKALYSVDIIKLIMNIIDSPSHHKTTLNDSFDSDDQL